MRKVREGEMTNPDQLFSDIGYHFVIMASGRIYDGRPEGKKEPTTLLMTDLALLLMEIIQLERLRTSNLNRLYLCVQNFVSVWESKTQQHLYPRQLPSLETR
jgi:hypothetical protein